MKIFYRQIHGNFGSRKDALLFESSIKNQLVQKLCCQREEKLYFLDSLGVDIPPYVCQFCTASGWEDMCLVADEDGYISIIDTKCRGKMSNSVIKVRQKWQCHKNAIFDVAWVPSGTMFATASGDTTAVLWDAISPRKQLNVFRGHSCSLKSICISKHNPNLIATGSRDGNSLIWDTRCPGQVATRIQDAHAIHDVLTPQRKRRRKNVANSSNQLLNDSRQTVTSVIFQDEHTLITSGAMDGRIKLWDLRKTHHARPHCSSMGKSSWQPLSTPKENIDYPGTSNRRRGYSSLALDSTHTRLFASSTDSTVYEYNLSNVASSNTRTPTRRYTGHFGSSFYVRITLSPDDMFLLSGSTDDSAYLWNTTSSGDEIYPVCSLVSGGMEQVSSVAWCPSDWTRVVTCSDDCAVRVWRIPPSPPCSDTQMEGHCVGHVAEPHVPRGLREGLKSPYPQPNPTGTRSASIEKSPLSVVSPNPTGDSSQKSQTSLKKWFLVQHDDESRCKAAKRLHMEDKPSAEKENTLRTPPSSSAALHCKTIKHETNSSGLFSETSSPKQKPPSAKVEFKSRKPSLSKNKRHATMEEYFHFYRT